MLSQQEQVDVGLPIELRRAKSLSVTARAARRVDKAITRLQERLEQDDTTAGKFFAGTIIVMVVLMLVVNVWKAVA